MVAVRSVFAIPLALTAAMRTASAEGEPPRREWYGGPIIAADVAVLTLFVVAGAAYSEGDTGQEVTRQAGVITYFGGGPVVHWVNGQVGRGFASLGLRFGAPIAGAIVGAGLGFAIDPSRGGVDTASEGAGVGALLGILAAPAIDASVLAFRPVPDSSSTGVRVAPMLGPGRLGAVLVSDF